MIDRARVFAIDSVAHLNDRDGFDLIPLRTVTQSKTVFDKGVQPGGTGPAYHVPLGDYVSIFRTLVGRFRLTLATQSLATSSSSSAYGLHLEDNPPTCLLNPSSTLQISCGCTPLGLSRFAARLSRRNSDGLSVVNCANRTQPLPLAAYPLTIPTALCGAVLLCRSMCFASANIVVYTKGEVQYL
ncbi:Uncharacterised protein [Clostridioides difficile]|nr:Uncharacterised protein [Clostridioides difficile]